MVVHFTADGHLVLDGWLNTCFAYITQLIIYSNGKHLNGLILDEWLSLSLIILACVVVHFTADGLCLDKLSSLCAGTFFAYITQ